MQILEKLATTARARELRFLVIGGHAVSFHGYPRTTHDVDLLICRDQRQPWLEALDALGHRLRHDGGNFLQFDPPAAEVWPLDLMLVNRASFDGMSEAAVSSPLGAETIRLVSLSHLLALKFFALKQNQSHRRLKDMDDVLMLVQRNGLNVREESFRALVEKYGNTELYAKVVQACG